VLGVDRCSSIKHYINAIKAKQSALNAQKPWSAVRNPTSALGSSGLVPIEIHHLLLNNITTACVSQVNSECYTGGLLDYWKGNHGHGDTSMLLKTLEAAWDLGASTNMYDRSVDVTDLWL